MHDAYYRLTDSVALRSSRYAPGTALRHKHKLVRYVLPTVPSDLMEKSQLDHC